MLEPEDQLVRRIVAIDRFASSFHIGDVFADATRISCHKPSADPKQLGVGDITRDRAFVERIGPDRRAAREAGSGNQLGGTVAIGDVQHATQGFTNILSSSVVFCSTLVKVMVIMFCGFVS